MKPINNNIKNKNVNNENNKITFKVRTISSTRNNNKKPRKIRTWDNHQELKEKLISAIQRYLDAGYQTDSTSKDSGKTSKRIAQLCKVMAERLSLKTLKKILKPSEKKKKQKQVVSSALKKLIGYLTDNCLELEGICRISGNITRVKELKKSFENDEDVDLSKIVDKHTISGALKMFLRDMDEPILTFELYKNFLGAYDIKDKNAKIAFIKSLLSALPKENQEILQMVLKFLYTVQLHQEKNKMTSANIAIVFAPTMLRPKEESFETMMNATNYTMDIVKSMVEEFNVLYEFNNTILYKISSDDLGKSTTKKSLQEELDEANAKIDNLLKQAAEDARERSVLETYSHQTYNKLQEEQENYKALQEEKDSIGELLNELRDNGKQMEEKNKLSEEKLQQQRDEVAQLKKKLEESNSKTKENESQLLEYNKHKQQLQAEVEKIKKALDEQKKIIDEKSKVIEEHKKTIDEKSKAIEEQKKVIDEQAKAFDEQKRVLAQKQQQQQQASVAVVNNNSSTDKKEQERLQKESQEKSKEIDRLQKDNQEKAKDIKVKTEQIEKITKERDEALKKKSSSSNSNNNSKEIEELQKKLKENENRTIQLEKEKETLNETVKSLYEQAKQLNSANNNNSNSNGNGNGSTGIFKKSAFTIGKRSKEKEKEKEKETPQLQDEDDVTAVKQFAFSWMILSLKSDAMAHGKNCNISSTDVFEELISKRIKVNQWTDFVSKKLKEVE
ncbi:RhoGAP domain-containing protein [Heterostelium album PN500]|uniref:RhoGAP domain-containing protein n=1 Tax=Heterostelium pallidum (strain ATCC 26659 / Pp 5 / PN500) TaxID=670386 RepID=D3BTZ7_HETP5|nr:RhoGAP domain-containing protein [Heterostelium album PN500]EFA75183.1 RhoGAP domain-containing protein [Heterostelium album PN500]|eukprot:XP_020427317.1 RhoGAP domain-containing protein [Heterostelium album PN500]